MLANEVFWRLMHFYTRYSCCNLQCDGFLLLNLIMMQSHRQSEFCANLMYCESDPGQAGYPTLERLHGKIWPRLGGSPHLSCKRDQIKMTYYMDRRVSPPKRVTSPTWGPPRPCKQALNTSLFYLSVNESLL